MLENISNLDAVLITESNTFFPRISKFIGTEYFVDAWTRPGKLTLTTLNHATFNHLLIVNVYTCYALT